MGKINKNSFRERNESKVFDTNENEGRREKRNEKSEKRNEKREKRLEKREKRREKREKRPLHRQGRDPVEPCR